MQKILDGRSRSRSPSMPAASCPSCRRADGRPSSRDAAPAPAPARNLALVRHAQERAQSLENRVADRITAFAGSMNFVYIHIAWFACWIAFRVEDYPFGLLTMIVSLEAIFLSTFVLISQNRADRKRQVIATSSGEPSRPRGRTRSCSLSPGRSSTCSTGAGRPDVTAGVPTARRRDDGRRS